MNDDLGRKIGDEAFGERIFFPKPVGIGKAHERSTGAAHVGAAVDGRTDDRTTLRA